VTAGPIVVLISYTAQPGQEERTLGEITALVATVVADEDACHGIELIHGADDPGRIMLIERWTSREAYEGPHMQTAHMADFIDRAAEFVAGPPDISFWI
jgi:quinol monooxygenase YgiN